MPDRPTSPPQPARGTVSQWQASIDVAREAQQDRQAWLRDEYVPDHDAGP